MERLCKIRDLQRAIAAFESQFEKRYGLGLNEGMALCSLHKTTSLSSGELGELLGLSPSHTSKIIRSVEDKGLVRRVMGERDKRNMYFSLTESGSTLLSSIGCDEIEPPALLCNWLKE